MTSRGILINSSHVPRERQCHECKMKLNYLEYLQANMFKYEDTIESFFANIDYLRKIWEDESIELLCCNCYELAVAKEILEKRLHSTDDIFLKE